MYSKRWLSKTRLNANLKTLLTVGLILLGYLGRPGTGGAQPLPAACPNGGPNYTPFGLSAFPIGAADTPLLKYTIQDPAAVCNDGTPAVMYIRPATANFMGNQLDTADQHPDKWVVVFHGGGGCGDEDQCLERWCGLAGMDRAGKMSTLGAHDAIRGRGILKREPVQNHYAGYNQVLLNYCSSDSWIGSEDHLGLLPSVGPSYDIQFQGEAIVRAAFQELAALGGGGGTVSPDPGLEGFEQAYYYDLPSLLEAEEVVLVGESAGSNGLKHHVDSIREWLETQSVVEPDVYAVADAAQPPAMYSSAIDWSDASSPTDYVDFLASVMEPRVRGFWGADSSAFDQSCLDPLWTVDHNLVGSHPEICLDTTYTLFEHITTPIFVRQDIFDTLAAERYVMWNLLPGGRPDFWTEQYNQNLDLSGIAGTALEQPFVSAPGVFGPKCNQHVSVLGETFFTRTITPVAGALSFHDLIQDWRSGGSGVQIQFDFNGGLPYTSSFCP